MSQSQKPTVRLFQEQSLEILGMCKIHRELGSGLLLVQRLGKDIEPIKA